MKHKRITFAIATAAICSMIPASLVFAQNFPAQPGQAPAGLEAFAEGELPALPEGERPELPEGMTEGEMPALPEGEMPEFTEGERPALPEGMTEGEMPEFTEGERPELPEGITEGELPELSEDMGKAPMKPFGPRPVIKPGAAPGAQNGQTASIPQEK